jgi:hypothetical protein
MKDHPSPAPPVDKKSAAPAAGERRKRAAAAFALLALPLVYFFPAVLGKVTLAPGDGWTQILGIRILIGNMLAQGQLPLWDPYIFGGMPLLASIQPGALYPATWLFAVLPPRPAMNVMVVTTYHVALIGTYLYGRRVGMSRVGALLAGVTFTFGGYMIAHLGHTNRIAAAAWLPWALLALEELRLRLRLRWVALGALFVALQMFAGEPQMSFYTILVAGAYGLFSLVWRRGGESRRRFLFGAAAMSVCGALLAMVQLLPAREMLKLGERDHIDYDYFTQFSFPPRQIFSLLAPYFFGGAAMPPYRVPYWGLWNLTETCGYAGLIALMLASIAVISQRSAESRDRLIWFWALCAAGALFLSFGGYLPFKINKVLYHAPVYKLFRASGRHMFEFTFAVGILAGFGLTVLPKMGRRAAWRAIGAGAGVMTLTVGTALAVYHYFSKGLVTQIPLPPQAGSLANPDIFIPPVFLLFGIAALLIYSRRWSGLSSAALAALLFLELMSFGFFYEWRLINRDPRTALADSPSVKYIKAREQDLSSFRIVSRTDSDPFQVVADLTDYPNMSIPRGLQSVNGYDPVRLWRMAVVAGSMTLDGRMPESTVLGPAHTGLDLLNTKYLLSETPAESKARVNLDGVEFAALPMDLLMTPGARTRIDTRNPATELAVISSLGRAPKIVNGVAALRVKIHTSVGGVIERDLFAGRDTSEWAYDRKDVKGAIKHDRARVIETQNSGDFQGLRYITRLPFDRTEVVSVEFESLLSDADVTIYRASFYDGESKGSYPMNNLNLPADRWRRIASFDSIQLYENLKVRPRAWFTPRVALMPGVEVLRTIKGGLLPDGGEFKPEETVLLESELFEKRASGIPRPDTANAGAARGEARVVDYGPQRIELQTRNERTEFLVLSEIYYRGWDCLIDGNRAPVERVDFTLRGVTVPAGEHRVEFVFRAPSFRNGAVWSLVGALLLVVGGSGWGRRRLIRLEKRLWAAQA